MKLLLIRHAKAEERAFSLFSTDNDAARRLSDEGRKSMRKYAKGLRQIVPTIDVLATSPLLRAHETAEIVADAFACDALIEVPALAPSGSAAEVVEWLKQQAPGVTVVLVGHEPNLGSLVDWLLTGRETGFIDFKKGGACLIEFPARAAPGTGKLQWLAPPSLLRRLV
ncbi:MAG: phosphohistidine phosphatase SixA [Gammaproteobacteria bacterium]|nr:phosphohistidine phosphatase SixA [Gammaproteobacteria bacterium]